MFHPKVLSQNQINLLKKIKLSNNFYLAGGTALALQKGIKILSKRDIAAMKVAAIVQRGIRRDFVDVYYLLKKYSLKKLIELAMKKYRGYQPMLILKALIYFKDAEKERLERGIKMFDPNFSWETAKQKIFEEVKKYQLSMIKE